MMMERKIRNKWLSFKETVSAEIISKAGFKKYSKYVMAAKYMEVYENLMERVQ